MIIIRYIYTQLNPKNFNTQSAFRNHTGQKGIRDVSSTVPPQTGRKENHSQKSEGSSQGHFCGMC